MKHAANVIFSGIYLMLLVTMISCQAFAGDTALSGGTEAAPVTGAERFAADTTRAAASAGEIPASFGLHQNYPNPFNPTTSIKYDVASRANVRLTVYDMLGKQVATLVDRTHTPGTYRVTFDASHLTSGVYILSMKAVGSFHAVRRMVLTK